MNAPCPLFDEPRNRNAVGALEANYPPLYPRGKAELDQLTAEL
jgi:hypothetical protein